MPATTDLALDNFTDGLTATDLVRLADEFPVAYRRLLATMPHLRCPTARRVCLPPGLLVGPSDGDRYECHHQHAWVIADGEWGLDG